PDPRLDCFHAGGSILFQTLHPGAGGQRVVRAQVLHVHYFEAGILGVADDIAQARRLGAGENIAVPEQCLRIGANSRWTDEAVSHYSPAVFEQIVHRVVIRPYTRQAEVLLHPYGCDLVPTAAKTAEILKPHGNAIRQSGLHPSLSRIFELL